MVSDADSISGSNRSRCSDVHLVHRKDNINAGLFLASVHFLRQFTFGHSANSGRVLADFDYSII